MDSSTFQVGLGETNHHAPSSHLPSKLKTYGFTVAIIVGICGLAIGAVGLAGYCHTGALSHMAQLDAILMIAAGGGGGTILLIVVGIIKNRQSGSRQQQHNNVSSDSGNIGVHRSTSASSEPRSSEGTITVPEHAAPVSSSATRTWDSTDCVYGREAWKQWKNIEIIDVVPPVPMVDLSNKDKILLYIPQRIRVNGKEYSFTLKALQEIAEDSFKCLVITVEQQFGDSPASGGWVLIDKTVLPESRQESYETQQKMVEERGCSLPSALEVATLSLMVFGLTGERLYGKKPRTYTRCLEKVDGRYPVIVGGFGSGGLHVHMCHFDFGNTNCGVTCARRKFQDHW